MSLARWQPALRKILLSVFGVRTYAQRLPSLPALNEDDIEETYVRGSGPGGQSINKTNISVSLLHKPTGIRVQCHQTRSREWNRSLARKILRERVDLVTNPGQSKLEAKWAIEASKKAAKDRKRRRKLKSQNSEAHTSPTFELHTQNTTDGKDDTQAKPDGPSNDSKEMLSGNQL